jgi:hypothetical protein
MAARLLPGTDVRVRRGCRRDLPKVQAVLGETADARLTRLFRRIVADLGTDVYVAEEPGGEIVGIVSVVYARSLMRGGLSAMLDGARARLRPARPILDGLVAFAEARARRRGCRRLTAWIDAEDAELRATLLARGYRPGEVFLAEMTAPDEPAPRA